jgi:hypothetical protein
MRLDVLRKGKVLGIKFEGQVDPSCLLMLSEDGERFEAHLSYSGLSVEKARRLVVGDEIQMIGVQCESVVPQFECDETHRGEDATRPIASFRVTNFAQIQIETVSAYQRPRG